MNLHEAVEAYIALKRALGARFDSQARVLRAFCRSVGEIDVANVKPDAVLAFLANPAQLDDLLHQLDQVRLAEY